MRAPASMAALALFVALLANGPRAAAASSPDTPSPSESASPTAPPAVTVITAAPITPALTLDPTSARPDDPVQVTRSGWKYPTCTLDFGVELAPDAVCTVTNNVLTGSFAVPHSAQPGTMGLVVACPTSCADSATDLISSATLTILSPAPVVVTGSGPSSRRSHPAPRGIGRTSHLPALTLDASRSDQRRWPAGLIAVVVALAALLSTWLIRSRRGWRSRVPAVEFVPRSDAGIITVSPRPTPHQAITIRLQPDAGRCRVEVRV